MGKEARVIVTEQGMVIPKTNVFERAIIRILGKPLVYATGFTLGRPKEEIRTVVDGVNLLKEGFNIETAFNKGKIKGVIKLESDPTIPQNGLLHQGEELLSLSNSLRSK